MILYKYYPPTTNSFKSIINAGLWCDNYTNMNDPFECLALASRNFTKIQLEEFKVKASQSDNSSLKILAQQKDDDIIDFMNSFRKDFIKENYYFASLSESYDNILLWSHYAASHTGFVLAIDLDETNNHIQKVTYQDTLPGFDMEWFFALKKDDQENSPQIAYLLKDFSIKSTSWSYEKEWRTCRKNQGYFRFKPEQVKALYYGLNCNTDIEKIIIMLLAYTDDEMPIYKMALSTDPLKMIVSDYVYSE